MDTQRQGQVDSNASYDLAIRLDSVRLKLMLVGCNHAYSEFSKVLGDQLVILKELNKYSRR